jgi:hypothetical protein
VSVEDEPWEALWKWALPGEIGVGDAGIGAQPFIVPCVHSGERGWQVGFGRPFREEHVDELFELEDRALRRALTPISPAHVGPVNRIAVRVIGVHSG